jgi:hypothetical protein
VGTDIRYKFGSRGWGSASDKNQVSFLRYRFNYQQRSLIPELACGRESNLLRQSVMLAQIFSVCGNLFRESFGALISNREEMFLSSGDFITIQKLVQRGIQGAATFLRLQSRFFLCTIRY